jgi:iron(III) transport system substrate-binding protein
LFSDIVLTLKKTILASLFLLTCGGCTGGSNGKTRLIIYSTHGKELLTEFQQLFERAHPEWEVRWLDMGSQDVLDRVRSEKENPQADLWWGAPSTLFQLAEKEGLLEPYVPSWAANVVTEARSRTGFWFGTYETPEVIAYNSQAIRADQAPKDWDDLLDPRWRGRIVIRDPLASGTMRTIFCAMIYRHYHQSGSPEAGYQWLKRLDANTKDYVANLTILSQKLARQEGTITLWNMPDIELQRSQYNYPLAYVVPRSGTPIVTDGIAIPARARHPETARLFYEFVTTKENFILAARKFFRIPCRKDIPAASLPTWMTGTSIPVMPLDWKVMEEMSSQWMKYWDTNIRNQGNQ